LEVKVTFEGLLDERHWCVDFGSLKSFKGWLEDTFDHKTLVATDDPELPIFRELDKKGIIQLREVPSTGCEAFSRIVYEYLEQWLRDNGYTHINLRCVEVREHGANSAYYRYF
jgi:6-pyruvoyltetrahydropterin/6-carboxytetrahydropterin synthase